MFKFFLVFFLFISPSWVIAKSKDWANVTYSSVRSINSEGDLIGLRFQIIHSNLQNFILLQVFEGEPLAPCFATAKIIKNSIKLTLPSDCIYKGVISGEIGVNRVVLEFFGEMGGGRARETLKIVN